MLKKPDADHEIYECGCHAPSLPLKCAYWPSFSSPLFLSPTHFSYPGPAFDSGGETHIQNLPFQKHEFPFCRCPDWIWRAQRLERTAVNREDGSSNLSLGVT